MVLTASGPTQPAWESSRFGHGFLTFYLIEALQGPAEIREGDRIGLLRLLDYVSRRVSTPSGAHITATLRETNWVVGGRRGAAALLGLPKTTSLP